MSEEREIQDYLDDILNAVYGEEVRESIVGAIRKCYDDGSAGSIDAAARQRLDVIEPIATSAYDTANANVLASLQAEKVLSQEGIHDLNLCLETGKYYTPSTTVASGVTNQPSDKTASTLFHVLVLRHTSANNLIQILVNSGKYIWIRRATYSSEWTFDDWVRIVDKRDYDTLTNAIDTKAPLASPELRGTPTATTAATEDNSTRVATTAFVKAAINAFKSAFDSAMSASSTNAVQNKVVKAALDLKANIAGPTFTGTPKITTTPAENDNSLKIASTAYADRAASAVLSRLIALQEIVVGLVNSKAPIESPTFEGTPRSVTSSNANRNDDLIATTAFVQSVKTALQNTISNWLYYAYGNTLTFDDYSTFAGYCGNSKRRIDFTVVTPYSLKNVSGIEVNQIKGAIFGVNGQVSGSTYTTDWMTHQQDSAIILQDYSATKITNNMIRVRMEFGSALDNTVNGTPITFIATNLKFTFYVNG